MFWPTNAQNTASQHHNGRGSDLLDGFCIIQIVFEVATLLITCVCSFAFSQLNLFQSAKCGLGAEKGQYGHALFLVHLAIMHRDVEVALSQHLHDSMAEDVFRTHVAGASNVISVIEAGNHINTFLITGDKWPVSLLRRKRPLLQN